jgi:hypothetical protein
MRAIHKLHNETNMFIGFSACSARILNQAIPSLLSMYQVETILDLPSPLKGEVLFLKGLIQYLTRTSFKSKEQAELIYRLAGAVKLFSLRFPEVASSWFSLLLVDGSQKIDLFFEARIMNHFIGLMFKWCFQGSAQISMFRNADLEFDGYTVFCQAMKHRVELHRLQLIHCSYVKPQLKQVHDIEDLHELEVLGYEDNLFSYLSHPSHTASYETDIEHKLASISYKLFSQPIVQNGDVSLNVTPIYFLKQALQCLKASHASISQKHWVCDGLLKLVLAQLHQPHLPKILKAYKKSLLEIVGHYQLNEASRFNAWKMSYATYLFCQSHLFKHGRPEKGLALVPLFGLDEGEIWRYWQKALSLMESASSDYIHSRLTQTRDQENQAVAAIGLYGFYSSGSEKVDSKEAKQNMHLSDALAFTQEYPSRGR